MKIRLTQFSIDLDYTEESLRQGVCLKLGLVDSAMLSCTVVRRSIDARRRRGPVRFTLTIDVELSESRRFRNDTKPGHDSGPRGYLTTRTMSCSERAVLGCTQTAN